MSNRWCLVKLSCANSIEIVIGTVAKAKIHRRGQSRVGTTSASPRCWRLQRVDSGINSPSYPNAILKDPFTLFSVREVYVSIRTTDAPPRAPGLAVLFNERIYHVLQLDYSWHSILNYIFTVAPWISRFRWVENMRWCWRYSHHKSRHLDAKVLHVKWCPDQDTTMMQTSPSRFVSIGAVRISAVGMCPASCLFYLRKRWSPSVLTLSC